jgi:gluconokinase
VERVFALDVGTSSLRAGWIDAAGTLAGVRHERYGPGPELDAAALAEAARAARGDAEEAAVSCFWHGLLALDARGRPCSPLYTWLDARSSAQAERLASTLDVRAVHERTGCRIHPSYWPSKLLWLREEQPAVWRRAARFVSFPDFLRSGGRRTSLSLASGTGLLDLDRGAWDDELLAAVGLEPERLPEVEGEPAWGDGACANVGAGCVGPDRGCVTIGTSAAYRVLGHVGPYEPALFRYLLDARRAIVGGAFSDGGNVYAWLERTLRFERPRGLAERPAAAHGLAFLTLLGGERSPNWSPRAAGAITGLTFETTPADLLQAALEGIAYRIAEVADALPDVREVVATGGALQADADWVQILADVLERPVVVPDVEEASLRGAGVLVLEQTGVEVPPPPALRVLEPRPERFEAHRAARQRQRELYAAVT